MWQMSIYDGYSFPCWALPFAVNGDESGLTESDIVMCREWLVSVRQDAERVGCYAELVINSNEPRFTYYPVFGSACECVDVSIWYVKRKTIARIAL